MEPNNISEIDLSCYRWDGTWEWLKEALSTEAGKERTMKQFDYLCDKMRSMLIGEELNLLKIVSNPKYYSAAVKIVCINILKWRNPCSIERREYEFNNTYTIVKRVI